MIIRKINEMSDKYKSLVEVDEELNNIKNKFPNFEWDFLYHIDGNKIRIYEFSTNSFIETTEIIKILNELNKKIEYLSSSFDIISYETSIKSESFDWKKIENQLKHTLYGKLNIR